MRTLFATALAMCLAGPALAAFDLRVTEIWMGNEPGENLTDDWIEITNFGDVAWDAAADGDLYYDDDSFDTTTADLMTGITSIAAGESVVYVNGSASTGGLNTLIWSDLWGPALAAASRPMPQVGTFDGSGLGQGGDSVGIWISVGPPVDVPTFTGSYPNAESNSGQSYDTLRSAFTTPDFPAVVTSANDQGQPGIGTPGYVTAVPEPGSLLLAGMALVFTIGKRR